MADAPEAVKEELDRKVAQDKDNNLSSSSKSSHLRHRTLTPDPRVQDPTEAVVQEPFQGLLSTPLRGFISQTVDDTAGTGRVEDDSPPPSPVSLNSHVLSLSEATTRRSVSTTTSTAAITVARSATNSAYLPSLRTQQQTNKPGLPTITDESEVIPHTTSITTDIPRSKENDNAGQTRGCFGWCKRKK